MSDYKAEQRALRRALEPKVLQRNTKPNRAERRHMWRMHKRGLLQVKEA